jgi:hypothetical protein
MANEKAKRVSSIFAIASMFSTTYNGYMNSIGNQSAEDVLKNFNKNNAKKKKPLPNGMKEFNIDGTIVYAINEKNALKKYNKNK